MMQPLKVQGVSRAKLVVWLVLFCTFLLYHIFVVSSNDCEISPSVFSFYYYSPIFFTQ